MPKRSNRSLKKLGRFFIVFILLLNSQSSASFSDNFFFKSDLHFQFAIRPASEDILSHPVLGYANIESGLQILDSLYFSLTAFGRIPIQAEQPHVDVFADLGDTFLEYTHSDFTLKLGQIRVPWSMLSVSAIGDRLNPIDYRRGLNFSSDKNSRIPQWGMLFRTNIFEMDLETVWFVWHRPNHSLTSFRDQDGVQIGRYQSAFAVDRTMAQILVGETAREELCWFAASSLGARLRKSLDNFDLGVSVVWGYDETPQLEGNLLRSSRNLSFGIEGSYALSIALVKAEAVITPKIGEDLGKVTLLRNQSELFSEKLTQLQVGAGVDIEYGDMISGTLELLDTFWFDVPANNFVHAVEEVIDSPVKKRLAQRLALVLGIKGVLFEEWLNYKIISEVGLNRIDLLSTIDLWHRFESTGFYIGAFTNLFFGVTQGAGWYKSDATQIGVKAGYYL